MKSKRALSKKLFAEKSKINIEKVVTEYRAVMPSGFVFVYRKVMYYADILYHFALIIALSTLFMIVFTLQGVGFGEKTSEGYGDDGDTKFENTIEFPIIEEIDIAEMPYYIPILDYREIGFGGQTKRFMDSDGHYYYWMELSNTDELTYYDFVDTYIFSKYIKYNNFYTPELGEQYRYSYERSGYTVRYDINMNSVSGLIRYMVYFQSKDYNYFLNIEAFYLDRVNVYIDEIIDFDKNFQSRQTR